MGDHAEIVFNEDSNASELATLACANSDAESCVALAEAAIQRHQHRLFGFPLPNWTYSETCRCAKLTFSSRKLLRFILKYRCMMPPRRMLPAIQFLHIPKTGTVFNRFLHSYFGCELPAGSDPCPKWMNEVKLRLAWLGLSALQLTTHFVYSLNRACAEGGSSLATGTA